MTLTEKLEKRRAENRAELGLAGMGAVSVLSSAMRKVRVRSSMLPKGGLTWEPGAGGAAKPDSPFVAWLKRTLGVSIDMETTFGDAAYAPHGVRDGDLFPFVVVGGALGALALGYLAVRGLRSFPGVRRTLRRIA